MGRANPAGNSVAGESYSVVSASSTTVTLSIRSQTLAATMARTSTKPGLTPLPNIEEPPRSHASTMRSRSAPSPLPLMNAAVLTTLTPASRIRTSSSTSDHIGVYSTQSGCSASSASTSSVALMPTGSDPQSSPTSWPTLSDDHA